PGGPPDALRLLGGEHAAGDEDREEVGRLRRGRRGGAALARWWAGHVEKPGDDIDEEATVPRGRLSGGGTGPVKPRDATTHPPRGGLVVDASRGGMLASRKGHARAQGHL